MELTLTLPGPSAGVSGSLVSYCSLKPLCSGMGEVVPARTSPTLLPHPLALCCHYPVSKCCSASIVATSTLRVKQKCVCPHLPGLCFDCVRLMDAAYGMLSLNNQTPEKLNHTYINSYSASHGN